MVRGNREMKKNYNIAPWPQLKPPGRSSGGGV